MYIYIRSFPGGSISKDSFTHKDSWNAGDSGSIPGLGRSPGVGNGNPLQYACLGNPTNRGRGEPGGLSWGCKNWAWFCDCTATMCILWLMHVCFHINIFIYQFSSVTQSCPALCNPMDGSTTGYPAHHQLLKCAQTHVHWWSHPTISSSVIPFTSCLQSFPASGSFPLSQLFASGGQIIGVSDSASVLPMNIEDWFPLGLTGWISLQSKGLSRVFSNTTVQKHQFFCSQHTL